MDFLARHDEAPRFSVDKYSSRTRWDRKGASEWETIYQFRDPKLRFNADKDGIIGWIVIVDSTLSEDGISKGGTAMYPGCDLETTIKKASVMARKQIPCHPLGLPRVYPRWGGAKCGIDFASMTGRTRDAELVWRGVVQAAWDAGIVPGKYIFGLDVGTDEHAARVAVDQVRSLLVVTGKPADLGGVEYDKRGFAGHGTVLVAAEMCKEKGFDLFDPTTMVVIQGFGAVGTGIARGLLEMGGGKTPRVIAVADAYGGHVRCLRNDTGLDLRYLLELKHGCGNIGIYAEPETRAVPPGHEIKLDCDVLFLASSRVNVITGKNAKDVRARAVVQGANLGITEEGERSLGKRGVLTFPDWLTNYASSASTLIEYDRARKGTVYGDVASEAWAYVEEVMRHNTRVILDMMRETGMSPAEVGKCIFAYELVKIRANHAEASE